VKGKEAMGTSCNKGNSHHTEGPSFHLSPCPKSSSALEQVPSDAVGSPCWEILKIQLDTALTNLL